MKKRILKNIIILNLLLVSNVNFAQTKGETDLTLWNSITLDYELNKKWNLGLEGQFRFKENISVIDAYFTEFSGEYKLSKGFRIGAALRYIRENDNKGNIQGYENHFRFHLEAKYKHKIKDLKIGYRLRYQNKNELGVSYDEGDFVNQNLRFKTSLTYNFKKWSLDPKFAAEIFHRFQEGKDNGFNKYRLTFGTDYKIKNYGEIGVYYRFEKQLNVDFPDTTNIIGLKYTYSFK
ncbi:DUF2490 domain-containing protein [uncultured Polaribacter sp.]|uniref:DUF2490 domain-containing protein n=1 Tax=uncultured Polaribacter sp. TaxID=174711 RepID=UPI00259AFE34|nr:DUF2490 domain-containing protein [uncultured Polaribacter sp.]